MANMVSAGFALSPSLPLGKPLDYVPKASQPSSVPLFGHLVMPNSFLRLISKVQLSKCQDPGIIIHYFDCNQNTQSEPANSS